MTGVATQQAKPPRTQKAIRHFAFVDGNFGPRPEFLGYNLVDDDVDLDIDFEFVDSGVHYLVQTVITSA